MDDPVIFDKSRHEFFNDYPCEWREPPPGYGPNWVLDYKTGSMLGWIDAGEADNWDARFNPMGWEGTEGMEESRSFEGLEDAKRWLEDKYLSAQYPEGYQFTE